MANYTIINDDELADFLADVIIRKKYVKSLNWHFCNKLYANHYSGQGRITKNDMFRIEKCVSADLTKWKDSVQLVHRTILKRFKRPFVRLILSQFDELCIQIGGSVTRGKRILLDLYLNSSSRSHMRRLSQGIYDKTSYRTTETYSFPEQDCLIRNILNNVDLLKNKITNNFPFWFVDSGYSNFTRDSSNKIYHRLCRSDLHAGLPKHIFPMDRLLQMVKGNRNTLDGFKFPSYWRTKGDTVLIIPPSEYICEIYGLSQEEWIKEQQIKLSKVTDKKVMVRQKEGTRKNRTTLYQNLLKDKSVYCVVGYNSNALTEAVWAGVPVITLGKHITNPVSRNSIEKINNLYRGDVSQWLCYLSYSQFTQEELCNGVAKKIIEAWHV